MVTDHIDTFTETGIRLKSGQELEADIIVTATGLNVQLLGGMDLYVDGEARPISRQMTYKGVLVQDLPNMAWIFGYTNAPWTLKSDLAAAYLRRLMQHMDNHGLDVAVPRDAEGCAEETADLLYHLAVLMEAKGFGWAEVVDLLKARHSAASSSIAAS